MATPDHPDSRTLPFEVHVADHESLWADASRATRPSHLVVTPVDLHQRNVETRLREASRPMSSLRFERIRGLAGDVVDAAGVPGAALDRVDRLALLREVVTEEDADVAARLAAVVGAPLSKHVETVERSRSELELVTGFTPARMEAFANAIENRADSTTADPATGDPTMADPATGDNHGHSTTSDNRTDPVTAETLDLLAGVSRIHDALRRQLGPDDGDGSGSSAGPAVSETSLLCRAIRALHEDPDVWTAAYPDVDRLSVAGTSMLTAPLEDFCHVLGRRTDVDVHVYLRAASGPAIRDQLHSTGAVDDPGTQAVFTWR